MDGVLLSRLVKKFFYHGRIRNEREREDVEGIKEREVKQTTSTVEEKYRFSSLASLDVR